MRLEELRAQIDAVLDRRLTATGRAWLELVLAEGNDDQASFYASFGSAGRMLGSDVLHLTLQERAQLGDSKLDWLVYGSAPDEIARVLLLSRATATVAGGA